MLRSEAERVRLKHAISRMRGILDGLEMAMRLPGPIGYEASNALVLGTAEVTGQIAKHDAFVLVEGEGCNAKED